MRRITVLSSWMLLGLTLTTAQAQDDYTIPAGTPDAIRAALQAGTRTDEQRARDAGRKPAHTLTLAEIAPGDRVLELGAFGHYYSTMLVEVVGRDGHVYMVDMPWIEPFGGEPARAFDAAHDNATFMQAHYNQMDLPQGLDSAMIVLFDHDLLREAEDQQVDTTDMNARIYAALRPGGTYLVIDHNAEAGSGWRDAMTLHRIDKQAIVAEVTAAGFELVHDSPMLSNVEDDHTVNMRAPEIRGMTDRAVLLFRKPAM
jgi:predicted methyltransferase